MFRCTDCNKEYEVNPGYCDCGNDQFEEIADNFQGNQQYDGYSDGYDDASYGNGYDGYNDGYNDGYSDNGYGDYNAQYQQPYPNQQYQQQQQQYQQPYQQPMNGHHKVKQKKPMSMMDKVGIGVFSLCILLSILAFIFIGKDSGKDSNAMIGTDSNGGSALVKNYSIPTNIDTIWDSTEAPAAPSASKVDPNKILNTKLGSIDQEMNAFLIGMAQAMIDNWDRGGVTGNGVTQMEFVVDKSGTIVGKKIYKYSGNKTLDDSVNKLISTFGKYQIPPSSYDQEIIIISFSAKNGSMKAYYPNVKVH